MPCSSIPALCPLDASSTLRLLQARLSSDNTTCLLEQGCQIYQISTKFFVEVEFKKKRIIFSMYDFNCMCSIQFDNL